MEPLTLSLLAGGAPVVGGLLGNLFSSGDTSEADQAIAEAVQLTKSLGLPPDLSKEIVLQKYQSAGNLTPEMEQYISAGVSKVSQIQEDPSLKQAQMEALQKMQQRASTGYSAEDQAAMNQLRQKAAADAQAQRASIMQNMQQRGLGGSGMELANMLQAQSANQQAESESADRLAALASQRSLDALKDAYSMGSNIRSQDFQNAQTKAAAEDAFRKFDVANQIGTQQRNVAGQNQANYYNTATAQQLANMNTQQSNAELQRQAQAKRQYWQDQLQRNSAITGAYGMQADQANKRAATTQNMWQSIGSGVGSAVANYPQMQYMSNANKYYEEHPNSKPETPIVNASQAGGVFDNRKKYINPYTGLEY